MLPDWPPLDACQRRDADAALQSVGTTVAVAQGLADCGRTVDLSGLDHATGALCARILDLAPEDGVSLRHALTELDRRLAVLAETLRRGGTDA